MTGIAPSELLADDLLYAASHEQAVAANWTDLHELVALNTEITHAVVCQLMLLRGAKPRDIPEPIHIPRPDEAPAEPPRVLSGLEAARAISMMGSD